MNTPRDPAVLDMIVETVNRIRATDPTDLPAALLAAHEGFACAYDGLRLLRESPLCRLVDHGAMLDDLGTAVADTPPSPTHVLAGSAPAFEVALTVLDESASIPNTGGGAPRSVSRFASDETVETWITDRLTKEDAQRFALSLPDDDELVAAVYDAIGADIVVQVIPLVLWQVHVLLAAAREHANAHEDRRACVAGTALSALVLDACAGRFYTFDPVMVQHRIARIVRDAEGTQLLQRLHADTRLMTMLRDGLTHCRDQNGWASLSVLGARLHAEHRGFDTHAWGFDTLTELLTATGVFEVRRRGRHRQPFVRERRKP